MMIASFYPNGEFSQGISAVKKRPQISPNNADIQYKKRRDKEGNAEIRFQPSLPSISEKLLRSHEGVSFTSVRGHDYTVLAATNQYTLLAWDGVDGVRHTTKVDTNILRLKKEWGLVPFGLSDTRILEKPIKSRKTGKSMTRRMGRTIRNAAYLLEEKYGKDNLSFLTLTLPNLTTGDLLKCRQHWGKMVNLLTKWLTYQCKKRGYESEYTYCTEIQTKRLETRNEYAPHLHLLFRGRGNRKQAWCITPKMVRTQWVRILQSVLCHTSFISAALENLQRIKKSAGGYLSKYLSKCAYPSSDGDTATDDAYTPIQWGGTSRNLNRAIKRATVRIGASGFTYLLVSAFISSMDQLVAVGLVRYCKRGYIEFCSSGNGGQSRGIHVAVGCLSIPTYKGGLLLCLQWLKDNKKYEEGIDILSSN